MSTWKSRVPIRTGSRSSMSSRKGFLCSAAGKGWAEHWWLSVYCQLQSLLLMACVCGCFRSVWSEPACWFTLEEAVCFSTVLYGGESELLSKFVEKEKRLQKMEYWNSYPMISIFSAWCLRSVENSGLKKTKLPKRGFFIYKLHLNIKRYLGAFQAEK